MTETGDWRLQGQDRYLRGISLQWRRCRAKSETWEHDHCFFCWTNFVDPAFSAEHQGSAPTERTLSEGYTTTPEYRHGAGYEWICADCFDEFVDTFGWRVVSD